MTDRRDPLGKRALFSAPDPGPDSPPHDPFAPAPAAGRRAFFSPDAPVDRAATSVATITCTGCGVCSPLGLGGLGRSVVGSIWLPGRSASRLTRCPSCGHWRWCVLRLGAPPAAGR